METIVLITCDEYSKNSTYISNGKYFLALPRNPTDKYQKLLQKTMQQCNLITDKQKIKYLDQKQPSTPTLRAQLKLHKPDIPFRPITNNMKAPSYKLSKHILQY
jgi:hypothetical protein